MRGPNAARFIRRQAEPVHPGVDMQRGAALPAIAGHERVPLGKLGHAVNHRADIVVDERLRSVGGTPPST